MIQTLNNNQLEKYVSKQLNNFFPDDELNTHLQEIIDQALKKVEYSFKHISLSYYSKNGETFFNHLNADHYTIFIYYCSNLAFKKNDISLASKFFYLNKVLHSFHCMYDTQLPDIFIVTHGVGTVLGKAEYSDYLVVTQGCTIGANGDWKYPTLSKYIILYPNSSILGSSIVAKNVILSNNSMLLNGTITTGSLVVGQYPNTQIKKLNKDRFSQFFKDIENVN